MKEENLIRRLRDGNRLALNHVMDNYTPYLSAVVWHIMGPAATVQDGEEVVSDVFLTLWAKRDTLMPEKGLKPWLATVARNKAIDRLRTCPPPSLPLEALVETTGPGLDLEVERRIFAAQLWATVEQLGPPDNALVFRFYYEGDRLKDIAADLGLTVPAAKVRLHRARQKLKRILMKGGSADGPHE